MDKWRPWLLAAAVAFLSIPLLAKDFYVTPDGTLSGDGTMESPWSLAKAMSHPPSVKPGDTIWLRGGTYTGHWSNKLKGEANKPIIVRQFPGERVIIDGNGNGPTATFDFRGSYTWFWGFEITNTDPIRTAPVGDGNRGTAISLLSRGSRLINLVIHDTGQGAISNDAAPDAEIYGCLIYYNGWDAADRGHGHGLYIQNDTGVKRIVDNIIFQQFGWGVHAYTEASKLNNLHFEGNTAFNNGLLSEVSGARTNYLIGASGTPAETPESSEKVAKKTFLVSNYSYMSGNEGVAANLGYNKGIASPTILDNYFAGGQRALALVNAFSPITMTGNTLYGTTSGFAPADYPGNTFTTSRPTGVKIFVRPNQYEPGRAHITVYNWDRVGSVNVSLKGILGAGVHYEVRNAQNFFGPPVLTGTYDGSSAITLPTTGLVPATPIGLPRPQGTGPDFQVFVVVPKPSPTIAKPPAAAFSFGPRSPMQGEAVAFRDLSSGSPASRHWDFGDASSGGDNVASGQTPTHTYAQPGTYTVRLTIANEAGSSTRSRNVTITASPGSRTSTLPVAGHIAGATGTVFVTDVALQNAAASPVSARLFFSPSGDAEPLEAPISLAAGETRLLADVVQSEFGITDSLGSLHVETEGSPPDLVRVAGRTYVENAGSTLGLGTVGLSSSEAATGDRYLSNLAITDSYRTNIGAVNTSNADQTFTLQLLDGHGNILGRSVLTLAAGRQQQWSLAQLFPSASGAGLSARIVPAGGGLVPLTYAAVTDNASSDPTYYAALGPAPRQFVPGIASITGVSDAFFRSEISIANGGGGPATVRLTFLEHDRDNSSAPSKTYVLGPYETLHADDALQSLFEVTDTYGALELESDVSPGVTVFERILTDATATPGTVGQQTDSVSAENLSSRGSLLGIRQDSEFRTNVGFLNPGDSSATVTLTLVRSPAVELGTAEVVVPARGYVQRNLRALFPAAELPAGEVLSIRYDASGQSMFAFASVIDNISQDPTFYPSQP